MVQPFLHLVQAAADIPCLVVVAYLVLVATGQACPGLVEVGLAFQALVALAATPDTADFCRVKAMAVLFLLRCGTRLLSPRVADCNAVRHGVQGFRASPDLRRQRSALGASSASGAPLS